VEKEVKVYLFVYTMSFKQKAMRMANKSANFIGRLAGVIEEPLKDHQIEFFIRMNMLESFKKLIRPEIANMPMTENIPPLHYACRKGDEKIEFVKLLLENGADINSHYKGLTPILLAFHDDNPKIIQLLIDNGADVNERLPGNITLLQRACINKTYTDKLEKIIQMMLDYGVNPLLEDSQGLNSFAYAINALVNPTRKVELIFTHKLANKELLLKTTENGLNVVFIACKNNNLSLAEQLVDYGFNIDNLVPPSDEKYPHLKRCFQQLLAKRGITPVSGGKPRKRKTKRNLLRNCTRRKFPKRNR
jgi:ankyrin repeat protein